jgi:hypothetical protein
MGGKLIQSVFGLEEKRLNYDDYFKVSFFVVDRLRSCFGDNHPIRVIPSYFEKDSFGDLDVLISKYDWVDYRKLIQSAFKTDTIHHNAGVFSFPIDGFQVDLITMEWRIFDAALAYFSWNDCGNLCGRCFHQLGLKYGHNGLTYVIRDYTLGRNPDPNGEVLIESTLSVDPLEILEFGGFNYKHFNKGFGTLEEMFDWVAKSKYFNAASYDFDKLNHINRTRNRKRTSYAYFVEWLKENKHLYVSFTPEEDKRCYLPMLCEAFPSFKEDLDKAGELLDTVQSNRSKFNAELLIGWVKELESAILTTMTGKAFYHGSEDLRGQVLGAVIKAYKRHCAVDDNEFSKFLSSNSHSDIKDHFINWYDLVFGNLQ